MLVVGSPLVFQIDALKHAFFLMTSDSVSFSPAVNASLAIYARHWSKT